MSNSSATTVLLTLLSFCTLTVDISLGQTWRELLSRADSLMEFGQNDSAASVGRKALGTLQEIISSKDTAVASLALRLAMKYRMGEVYDLAERYYDCCVKIRKAALGPNHADVAKPLNGLAIVAWVTGRYDEAEALNEEALAIRERSFGREHLEVSESLSNLGMVLLDQRRYREAQELLTRALMIEQKILGERNLSVALSELNLGNAFYVQADYEHAEEYYNKALRTREVLLGKRHPEVAQVYDNLGVCYEEQGRLAEAEQSYKQALAIFQDTASGGRRDLAICLQNLGIVSTKMRNFEQAEHFLAQALDLRRRIFQRDNAEVAVSYANLADLLSLEGRYGEAESLYRRAIPLSSENERLPMMKGLADLYRDNARFAKAESLYRHIETLWHRFSGVGHPQRADFLESYSVFFRHQRNAARAESYARSALLMRKELFAISAPVMSERDALLFSSFIKRSLSNYLSCVFKGSRRFAVNKGFADQVLSAKGVVSDLVFERRKAAGGSISTAIAKRLRDAQVALVRLYGGEVGNLTPQTHKRKLDSLSTLCNRLESQLARHSSGFRRKKDYQNVTAQRIASLLPSHSTLVEYLKWDYFKLNSDTPVPHYLAVVLDRRNRAHVTDLGEAERIDGAVNQYRQHMIGLSEKLVRSGLPVTEREQEEYLSVASMLYALLWQPLEAHITDRATVFIAPDGGLNLISFAGLINTKGEYLIEKYPLHYLSAGRDLIRMKDRTRSGKGLIAFGDPDYDAAPALRLGQHREHSMLLSSPSERADAVRSGCGALKSITVGRLPNTRVEVESLAAYWNHNAYHEPALVYTGAGASEENFKANSYGKRVIHLATHGYFIQAHCLPEQQRKYFQSEISAMGENPLLLSGVFLAGANLHGAGTEDNQAEDGIVSALEVSAMDMSGVDLVVLSACETGLGEVRQGEGVYGLRRAFQLAGAKTVVSALWRVPDNETNMLMKSFYAQQGTTYPELMQRVALQHLHGLRAIGRPTHPYSWGGFVVTGDWRRN